MGRNAENAKKTKPDADHIRAKAAYLLHRGNYTRAAKEADIPVQTLRGWAIKGDWEAVRIKQEEESPIQKALEKAQTLAPQMVNVLNDIALAGEKDSDRRNAAKDLLTIVGLYAERTINKNDNTNDTAEDVLLSALETIAGRRLSRPI